ncbi:UbiA family prenyltransferase [Nibribacter koreensis]|uniref:UbiA prenyltransferase family protein n=1 Tax=Nibribacter koreensis TaxID=1084519 RepID=A0ABP8FU12_9BACT
MRYLLKILDFILFSNIFIAACATALVWETYLLSGMPMSTRLGVMAFFATLFVYNADSLLPYKFNQDVPLTKRMAWVQKNRLVLMAIAATSVLCVFALYWMAAFELSFWFMLHLMVVAGLYSIPVLPDREGYIPLRDIPFLKVFLIAYVWSAITVQLPQMEAGRDLFAADSLILFVRRFLFIFALTLVFDIRDLNKDRMTGTVTFPGKWGVAKTKRLALMALLLFAVLLPATINWQVRLALGLSALGSAWVVWNAHENRSHYYFLVLADGMMLLQFLLVWLLM